MSSHHVIYACHCLNVKIQLAKKYYLDKHEQYRQSKFTRTHDPTLSGWLFELNTEGIVIVSKQTTAYMYIEQLIHTIIFRNIQVWSE